MFNPYLIVRLLLSSAAILAIVAVLIVMWSMSDP